MTTCTMCLSQHEFDSNNTVDIHPSNAGKVGINNKVSSDKHCGILSTSRWYDNNSLAMQSINQSINHLFESGRSPQQTGQTG